MADILPTPPVHEDPATTTHKEVSPKDSTFLGFEFALDLGFTIAIPAVLFGLLGRYVDIKWGTSHWFFMLGLGFAFLTSFVSIFRKVRVILARMPKDLPRKKKPVDPQVDHEQQMLHDLFRPPKL